MYYISGVDGKANVTGTTYDKDNNATATNKSLVDATVEEFKITSAYGEEKDGKYYNIFDVVVKTKGNPYSLKLVPVSGDATLTSMNQTITVSSPAECVTNYSNWDAKEWSATEANYLKYTVTVPANVTLSATKSQVANLQFKDYPMLALGVAKPAGTETKLSGTYGLLTYAYTKSGFDYSFNPEFTLNMNNIFTEVTDENETVLNTQYSVDSPDGEYYPVDVESNFQVVIRTNKTLGTDNVEIQDSNVLSVGSTVSIVPEDGGKYGINTYTYDFTVAPYTGTLAFESSKYTIYATTQNATTPASAYYKTVYQNGNYHALSYGILDDNGTFKGYGYLKDNDNNTLVYSDITTSATTATNNSNESYTFYIRTNMVDSAKDLEALLDTTTYTNVSGNEIDVTKMGSANVYYNLDYWKVYNFGNHIVFKVVVTPPTIADTDSKTTFTYAFPAPNNVGLTPKVTITRPKYVAQ